jgi:LysM repeat protein
VNCYSCDQTAVNACKRCAKPYCEDHGNASYCAACLQPASALPSFNLYRGALLVMLIGTAVAVFLLIRPPGETKGAPPVVVGKTTPTPGAPGGQPTSAPQTPQPTAGGSETPETTGTPSGSETPDGTTTPRATGTPSPYGEYIVVAGDTLFDIAVANLPAGDDPVSFAKAIAALNGLDYDAPVLPIGKKLALPKPKPTP